MRKFEIVTEGTITTRSGMVRTARQIKSNGETRTEVRVGDNKWLSTSRPFTASV